MSSANPPPEFSPAGLPFSFDQDDSVLLHVGPTQHVLLAHGAFITRNSDFFKAALKKEWAEGQTRVIKLPEEKPHVVSHYLNYTYTNKLPLDSPNSYEVMAQSVFAPHYYVLLAELYVLGERLLDQSIRTAVIEKFIDLEWYGVSVKDAANIIYRGTTTTSPARRLMVDFQVKFGQKEWLDDSCEAAFLLDVSKVFCFQAWVNTPNKGIIVTLNRFHYTL